MFFHEQFLHIILHVYLGLDLKQYPAPIIGSTSALTSFGTCQLLNCHLQPLRYIW